MPEAKGWDPEGALSPEWVAGWPKPGLLENSKPVKATAGLLLAATGLCSEHGTLPEELVVELKAAGLLAGTAPPNPEDGVWPAEKAEAHGAELLSTPKPCMPAEELPPEADKPEAGLLLAPQMPGPDVGTLKAPPKPALGEDAAPVAPPPPAGVSEWLYEANMGLLMLEEYVVEFEVEQLLEANKPAKAVFWLVPKRPLLAAGLLTVADGELFRDVVCADEWLLSVAVCPGTEAGPVLKAEVDELLVLLLLAGVMSDFELLVAAAFAPLAGLLSEAEVLPAAGVLFTAVLLLLLNGSV